MKQLGMVQMEELQGGIACSQLSSVLSYLAQNNPSQLVAVLETFSIFGHGGTYELQCTA